MEMWTSLLIVLAVFALGDVISILTKARISSLFVIMMTFLILFLTHTIPPDIVKRAGSEYNVSLIGNYVYDLAKEFNQFYHDFPMLREKDEALRAFRLLLSKNVAITIKKGMVLFGIEVPERM